MKKQEKSDSNKVKIPFWYNLIAVLPLFLIFIMLSTRVIKNYNLLVGIIIDDVACIISVLFSIKLLFKLISSSKKNKKVFCTYYN